MTEFAQTHVPKQQNPEIQVDPYTNAKSKVSRPQVAETTLRYALREQVDEFKYQGHAPIRWIQNQRMREKETANKNEDEREKRLMGRREKRPTVMRMPPVASTDCTTALESECEISAPTALYTIS